MSTHFKVRLFRPDDLPGILRLWEDHSGWGAITQQQWRRWYMDTPWGESVVAVVEDHKQELVGQVVFTPFPILVNKISGIAYRISAPILNPVIRAGKVISSGHPTRKMLEVGLSAIRPKGALAAYATPLLAWRGFFRRIPGFQLQEYGCGRIDLEAIPNIRETDLQVEAADSFSHEHSNLWQEAITQMPIKVALVRTEPLWNYRLSDHLVLNIREQSGQLLGYMAVKRGSGLVVDLLTRKGSDIKRLIKAGVQALICRRKEFGHDLGALKLMITPQFMPYLDEMGMVTEDFRFLFCIVSMAEEMEPEAMRPSHWFITAGD